MILKSSTSPSFLIKIIFSFVLICGLYSMLSAQSDWNAPGDTLTVIMSPILNIPAIHIPGESMYITALADQNTSGFEAALLHENKRIPLQIQTQSYNPDFGTWHLSCLIPNIAVFELYDLELSADNGIHDVSSNAVKILPTRKTNYYFVHLTDLHLPNRLYYPNNGFDTDSTEVMDFRAVIEDVNLINPEFVLLTGDLLNEGELEGLAGQYWYGWTQRLLELFEVPVFVLSGNHDIGGWDSTPGTQGSSRRHWWRYFGWPWLNNSNSNWDYHTQDYSFEYNGIQYIGLETYINYDDWRYYIYGNTSLIDSQILWLQNEIANSNAQSRVLFYHYDFDDQIFLDDLNVDLALWGHTHSDAGDIDEYPYNLSTQSVCGNRAFRVIRVADDSFSPQYTIQAGDSGYSLYSYFEPSNNAVADSVTCVIVNNYNMAFDNSLIKFNMPPGNDNYTVYGGSLLQIDRQQSRNVCYVKVHLLPSLTRHIRIATQKETSNHDDSAATMQQVLRSWPNPFAEDLNIQLKINQAQMLEVSVYNLRGAKIKTLFHSECKSGDLHLKWDSRDHRGIAQPSGIYFLVAKSNSGTKIHKLIKYGSASP